MEVVASLSQGRTAAAQCGLFTHKSVPVIFEPPCIYIHIYTHTHIYICTYIWCYCCVLPCILPQCFGFARNYYISYTNLADAHFWLLLVYYRVRAVYQISDEVLIL